MPELTVSIATTTQWAGGGRDQRRGGAEGDIAKSSLLLLGERCLCPKKKKKAHGREGGREGGRECGGVGLLWGREGRRGLRALRADRPDPPPARPQCKSQSKATNTQPGEGGGKRKGPGKRGEEGGGGYDRQ